MISSKLSIEEKYWDEKKKLIKVSHSNGEALNRHITKQLADLQSELLLASDEKVKAFVKTAPIVKVKEIQKQTVFELLRD